MPKKTVRQTVKDCARAVPDAAAAAAAPGAPARAPLSPLARREAAVRRVLELVDPLRELARLAAGATDPKLRLDALKALAPYLYPQQKAVEVTGAGGEQLVVEVRRVSDPGANERKPA